MDELTTSRRVQEGTEVAAPTGMLMIIETILHGHVSLEPPTIRLPDLALRLAAQISTEQAKPLPDNALLATLCEAARLLWSVAKERG